MIDGETFTDQLVEGERVGLFGDEALTDAV